MSSVDERVVRMEFEDANFEAGATKALSILEKLQNALKFEGMSDGLDSVKKSLSGFNTSSIDSSISATSNAFSVFEQIGIGALRQIGAEVVHLASTIASRLTSTLTSGARDGFNEYQLQINSLQTIAANSGEKMEVIKENLDELNEYADKTIYNFSEMTANIGRFTAAGLDVETSTRSIKGFANMAALAGAGAQETSRGMYQLSQAMASGVVKLQDWKSIQNASIDTAAFKDILIETARAMDSTEVSVDAAIEKQGSFNQSLSEGWLTADVMAQALQVATMSTRDFADEDEGLNQRLKELAEMGYSEEVAKKLVGIANSADDSAREVRTLKQLMETVGEAIGSGWAKTWELIIGDFDEATQLFTTISKRFDTIIGGIADSRNKLVAAWKSNGGRDDLIGIFSNLFEAVSRVAVPIKDAFTNIFGVSGKQLAILTENVAEFTSRLVISEDAMNALKTLSENIFSIIHSVFGVMGNVFRSLATTVGLVMENTEHFRGSISDKFGTIIEVLERFFYVAHSTSDKIGNIFQGMYKPISLFINSFLSIFIKLMDVIGGSGRLESIVSSIGSIVSSILLMARRAIDILFRIGFLASQVGIALVEGFSPLLSLIAPGLQIVADLFKKLETKSLSFTKGFADFSYKAVEVIYDFGRVLKNAVQIAIDFGKAVYQTLFDPFTRKTDFFANIFDTVATSVSNLMSSLGNIGDFIKSRVIDPIRDLGKKLELFGTDGSGLPSDRIEYFSNKIIELRDSIVNFIGNENIEKFKTWFSNIGDLFSNIKITIPKSIKDFGSKFLGQSKQQAKGTKSLQNDKKIIGDYSKNTLPSFGSALLTFGGKIKETFYSIKRYFSELSPQKLASDLSGLIDGIVDKIRNFSPSIANGISGFADKIKSMLSNITIDADSFGGVFDNIKKAIASKLEDVPEPIKSLFDRIRDTFEWGKSQLQNEAGEITFENIGINLSNLGANIGTALSSFADGILSIPDMTGNLFDTVVQKAQEFVGKFPSFDKIAESGDVLLKGGLIVALTNFITSFKNVNKSISGLADSIKKWPTALENGLKGFGEKFGKFESKADAILKVAAAIAILAVSLFLLASIPGDDLAKAGKAMGALAIGLVALLAVFEALEKAKFFNPALLVGVGAAFSGVAIGVLALAAAAVILSLVPEEQLSKGINAVIQLITVLSLYAFALQSNGSSMLLGSIGLIIMAGAIGLLIDAVKRLGDMDADQLKQGLDAFTQLMVGLAIFGALGAKGISLLLGAFLKFGAGVLLLSLSLGFLAAGLVTLSNSLKEIDNLEVTLGVAAGFIVAFTVVCLLLKKADPIGVGAGLLIFAAAIAVFAAALAGLSAITNLPAMAVGLIALISLVAVFGLLAHELDASAVIKVATALVIFSAAITVLAIALGVLSYVNMGTLAGATVAILSLVAAFGLIAYFVKPEATYATAMALIQFSAAVMILALAFKVLETVNMMSVVPALVGVLVTMGLFAAAAVALGPAAGAMALMGSAMLTFSIAVLALAAAFWLFSDAIANLNSVGPERTAEVMAGFGEGLGHILDEIIARIPDLISAIVQGLLQSLGPLGQAALELVGKLGTFIIENAPQLLEAGKQLVGKLVEGLLNAAYTVMHAVPEIINWFTSNFAPFMGSVTAAGGEIINTLKNGILGALPAIQSVGENVVQGLVNGITSVIGSILEAATNIGNQIITTVKNVLGVQSPSTVMAEIGGNVVQGLIDGIGSFLGSLGEKALEIGTTVINGVTELPGKLAEKAGEGMSWFVNGISGFFGQASETGTAIATNVGEGVATLTNNLKTKATDGMNSFVGGVQSKIAAAKAKANEVKNGVVNAFNTLSSSMRSKASDGVNAFVGALNGGIGSAKSAAAGLANAAKNGLGSLWGTFRDVGSNAVSGLVSGISGMIGTARAKAAELASVVAGAAQSMLKINSPSKVFRAIGMGVGEGFVQGLDRSIAPVEKASENLAASIPDAFSDGLRAMSFDIDDMIDTDYNPVITPVIDPTEFNSDLSMLSSAMNGSIASMSIGNLNYTGELSAKISDATAINKQALDAIAKNGINYDRLGVSVANALISSGVYVKMDGGQMVGYLAGEIRDARRQYVR